MKALFIGGTGTISSAISRLAAQNGWELYLLNRGRRAGEFSGKNIFHIDCDVRTESEGAIRAKLESVLKDSRQKYFDTVAEFIAFVPEHLQKDFAVFNGLCRQFMFISSASAYQKPLSSYLITESTPLANPYWEYSRNKIACEEYLTQKYRECGFPITIIRPSHTYDERNVPLGVHGKKGSWQVLKRMISGKPVIIHGDGASLWTLTHNSDFARAFVPLMGNIHATGEALHITTDESVTWNQIYQIIADALNIKLNAVHIATDFLVAASRDAASKDRYDFLGGLTGDKSNTVVFDNTKLKRLVPGFYQRVSVSEGIRATVSNVMANPALQEEDSDFDEWCDKVIKAQEKALVF
jgi:nucleoside-diphosphate-sugar epimerase